MYSRRDLILFAVLAALLRFSEIGRQSFWFDEAFSAGLAEDPSWPSWWQRIWADVHPPLYPLLLRGWSTVAGQSDSAYRLLSALFGVAAVVVSYRLGMFLGGKTVARIGAFLFAISPYQIYYSQETRSYALYSLLAVVSMLAFYRLLAESESGHRRSLFALAIANACLLATHYLAGLILAVQALSVAVFCIAPHEERAQRLPALKAFLLSALLTTLFFAPLLPLFADQFFRLKQSFWTKPPELTDLKNVFVAFLIFRTPSLAPLLCAAFLLALGLLLALPRSRSSASSASRLSEESQPFSSTLTAGFLLLWLLVPPIVCWTMSQVTVSTFLDRTLIGAAPAEYLLIAWLGACSALPKIRLALPALVAVAMLKLYPWLYTATYKDDWRTLASLMDKQASGDDALLFDAPSVRLAFYRYYHGAPHAELLPGELRSTPPNAPAIWVISSMSQTPLPELIKPLREAGYVRADSRRLPGGAGIQLVRLTKGK